MSREKQFIDYVEKGDLQAMEDLMKNLSNEEKLQLLNAEDHKAFSRAIARGHTNIVERLWGLAGIIQESHEGTSIQTRMLKVGFVAAARSGSIKMLQKYGAWALHSNNKLCCNASRLHLKMLIYHQRMLR